MYYFLATKHDNYSGTEFSGGLLNIKAYKDISKIPHIGFKNEFLGHKYIKMYNLTNNSCVIIPESELASFKHDFSSGVLIYENIEQIEHAKESPEDYEFYDKLVINYSA